MRDKTLLKQLQSLPLDAKIHMTQQRIREWYNHFYGDVVVSFSGGKDSTVLAHLVHDMYPQVPLVFANTGLEYPEIQAFARKVGAEFVRPKMRFDEVISKYGYPIISKEVAEAIHYARRIVPQSAESINSPEKESVPCFAIRKKELDGTRDDTELLTERKNRMETSDIEEPNYTDQHSELHGRTGWRRAALTAKLPDGVLGENDQTISEKPKGDLWGKTDWSGWIRKAIAGVEEGFTGKSQFNKKKWLPLCQETQFYISHYCCNVMKKGPMGIYQRQTGRKPFIGTMAEESRLRTQAWVRHGCNAFDNKKQTSQPMSFWTEQDVLKYILLEGLEICSVYGDIMAVDELGFLYAPLPGVDCKLKCTGCQRTGRIFCGFGITMEKAGETRFQKLAKTHPRQYEYCMGGGQWVDNPKYDPVAPKMDGDWENWNPKKIWVPSKEGLGMKKVFDDCNQIYGKDFIRYE